MRLLIVAVLGLLVVLCYRTYTAETAEPPFLITGGSEAQREAVVRAYHDRPLFQPYVKVVHFQYSECRTPYVCFIGWFDPQSGDVTIVHWPGPEEVYWTAIHEFAHGYLFAVCGPCTVHVQPPGVPDHVDACGWAGTIPPCPAKE